MLCCGGLKQSQRGSVGGLLGGSAYPRVLAVRATGEILLEAVNWLAVSKSELRFSRWMVFIDCPICLILTAVRDEGAIAPL